MGAFPLSELQQSGYPTHIARGTMPYQLQRIQQKHRELIRYMALGIDDVTLAKWFGVTTLSIRNLKNTPMTGTPRRPIEPVSEENKTPFEPLSGYCVARTNIPENRVKNGTVESSRSSSFSPMEEEAMQISIY